MNYHVLTLFPEMIENGMNTSITGRAITKGLLSLEAINIRDFAFNKHQKVDDYPYGGGAGMLMQAEPVYLSYESIVERIGRKPRVIFLTPQGKTFNQNMAKEFALEEDLVFLCGHYEGIDERVLEEIVTDYVSIGDYVLTGGELPAMVMMDSISRMVPGVLNNQESGETESFSGNLLEYPQYSRPEEWHGKKVPEVLLSGHHANVDKWRREQSIIRTAKWRPDLLPKADLTNKEWNEVRIALPKATKVCCNFPETKDLFPEGKAVVTGTPIREELFRGDSAFAYNYCGFTDNKPVLLIVGGSSGSVIINNAIRDNIDRLLETFNVIHLCGKDNLDESLKDKKGYVQYEYVKKELASMLALCDIIISRAGANAICELLALRKPNILIPLSKAASRGDQILRPRAAHLAYGRARRDRGGAKPDAAV